MLNKQQVAFVRSLEDANGHLDPDLITAKARDPDCPLHVLYEWDPRKAAEKHWQDTSKQIIRFVRLEITVESERVVHPVYVVDPHRPTHSHRYLGISTARRDQATAILVLQAELDRIAQAIERAIAIAAALDLSEELEEMLANVSRLRELAAERRGSRKKGKGDDGKPGRPKGKGRRKRTPTQPEVRT